MSYFILVVELRKEIEGKLISVPSIVSGGDKPSLSFPLDICNM